MSPLWHDPCSSVDDGLIKRNPCRIDGAGQEHSPERPVLTVTQVFALADAFTDRRYRLLTTQRDKLIADEISKRAEAELKRSGTKRARGKNKRS